jgi:hypothetical protein
MNRIKIFKPVNLVLKLIDDYKQAEKDQNAAIEELQTSVEALKSSNDMFDILLRNMIREGEAPVADLLEK